MIKELTKRGMLVGKAIREYMMRGGELYKRATVQKNVTDRGILAFHAKIL